jgi:hypothetical protein
LPGLFFYKGVETGFINFDAHPVRFLAKDDLSDFLYTATGHMGRANQYELSVSQV